jgi:hypothetical protein
LAETDFTATASITTPVFVEYGDAPTELDFEITNGDTKVSITSPSSASSTLSDEISIVFTLTNSKAETSSIKPQYSTDGEVTWSDMTDAGGSSEGKTGLSSLAAGDSHTFIWNSVTDLGLDHKGGISIRIIAYDGDDYKGDIMTSDAEQITVNNAPQAPTLISPIDGYFAKDETPQFVFTIPNPRAGNSKMHFKLQLDTVDTFNSSNLIELESRNNQNGWEYVDTGSNWVDIPHAGIDIPGASALIGNQARITIQTEDKIAINEYKWRIVAGGTNAA